MPPVRRRGDGQRDPTAPPPQPHPAADQSLRGSGRRQRRPPSRRAEREGGLPKADQLKIVRNVADRTWGSIVRRTASAVSSPLERASSTARVDSLNRNRCAYGDAE